MWALRQVISYLWSTADWLDTTGTYCNPIPVFGPSIRYALQSTASSLRSAAWSLYDFDSWIDSVATAASAAYSYALSAYNYAYGYLSDLARNAAISASNAYSYAANTVYNLANSAMQRANEAYNYASGWLKSQLDTLTSNFWSNINAILSWKDGFVSTFWTQINSVNTGLNDLHSLIPSQKTVIDWISAGLGGYISDAIQHVTAYAASYADPLWQCADALVGKLTEWRGK